MNLTPEALNKKNLHEHLRGGGGGGVRLTPVYWDLKKQVAV